MDDRIAETHGGRSKRPWKWVWFLAISAVFTGFAACVTLVVSPWLEKGHDTNRFMEEVRRLGGSAHVPPGAFDINSGTSEIYVDFGRSTISDESFERFASMPAFRHARFIDLSDTRIGDRSIELIAEKAIIVSLNLSRTAITDRSLEALSRAPGLNNLYMSGTNVTDAGLESLRKRRPTSPTMMLDLTDTEVSEDEVRRLFAEHNQWTIIYGSSKSPKTTR